MGRNGLKYFQSYTKYDPIVNVVKEDQPNTTQIHFANKLDIIVISKIGKHIYEL